MAFEFVDYLSKTLPGICEPLGFRLLDLGDRHGSWEWMFSKRRADLDCFVSVALTRLSEAVPPSPWHAVEVWAGADDGNRFVRRLVLDFRASESAQNEVRAKLEDSLVRATKLAESFRVADLAETYLPSRVQR